MVDPIRLSDVPTTAAGLTANRTVLVPLGATEGHGPHLPLGTDTLVAVAWAERLSARIDGSVVAPPLPYGSSGEHQDFAGTLSIGAEALEHVLVELVQSASVTFSSVVLVSGHAGNDEVLCRTAKRMRYEGHRVAYLVPRVSGDAHAGRTETSLILHLRPALVDTTKAEPGRTEPLADLMDDLRSDGVRAVSPNGVLGDPTGATATEGERIMTDLVAYGLAAIARQL